MTLRTPPRKYKIKKRSCFLPPISYTRPWILSNVPNFLIHGFSFLLMVRLRIRYKNAAKTRIRSEHLGIRKQNKPARHS